MKAFKTFGLLVVTLSCAAAFAPHPAHARIRLNRNAFRASTIIPRIQLTSTVSSSSRWEKFDYLKHWYPVVWACDLKPNVPSQQSLFDTNYAVAITETTDGNTSVIALEDRCPHKGAALSEGRVTKTGYLQCAYHGWSFDEEGTCVQIPQSSSNVYSAKACSRSVPAIIHQGMVWLWPGPIPEGSDVSSLPSPPSVAEMDDPKFRFTKAVRDFPCLDWTLLLSNIMDPDHGVFAHQNPAFDWYSGSKDFPMVIEETFVDDGWQLEVKVPAQEKVRRTDRQLRGDDPKELPTNVMGTTTFHAPTHVTICRRNVQDGSSSFITAFWVCPTGTGRSRFMSAGIGKLPFDVPRWITHISLNRFLDQDTVLVTSQQPPVLTAEYEALEGNTKGRARGSLFVYQSPSDKFTSLVDKFWDETLHGVPKRKEVLRSMKASGALDSIPPRTVVLDRKAQHLDVCPDSQDLVRTCRWIKRTSVTVVLGWAARAIYARTLKRPWLPIVMSITGLGAETIRKQFYYAHTEDDREKDLKSIPTKMWLDPK